VPIVKFNKHRRNGWGAVVNLVQLRKQGVQRKWNVSMRHPKKGIAGNPCAALNGTWDLYNFDYRIE